MDYTEFNNSGVYGTNDPNGGKPRRSGDGFITVVVIVIVLLLIALFAGVIINRNALQETAAATATPQHVLKTPEPDAEATDAPALEATATPQEREMPELDGVSPNLPGTVDNPIPDIFEAVAPGVVGVVNYQYETRLEKQVLSIYGSGSGFVISTDGYIITNAHVVDDAAKITVLFEDGDEVEAELIGSDTDTDIAVLKIERKGLTALALGDSDAMRVGDYVLAIGNPLDTSSLANTLTFGIVSAKARELTIDGNTNTYIQTDAAINFGNSGGPLINFSGEVIGINSAKTVTAGYDDYGNAISAEGIGFALPINEAMEIVGLLIQYGTIERPAVGIMIATLDEMTAGELGVPQGVYVDSVVTNGPAYQAGLRAGDVIVEAAGERITTQAQLIDMIGKLKIGDTIELNVYRDGAYLDFTIHLGDKSQLDFDDTDGE